MGDGPGRSGADRRSRRRGYGRALTVGLILSLAGHLLAFELSPPLKAPDLPGVVGEFRAVEVRPVRVEPPPPPDPVPRPTVPEVERTELEARTANLERPSLEEPPAAGELPSPPPPAEAGREAPSYIHHQVAPRPDRTDLQRERIDRYYPPELEESGVEGVVDLRVFVDREGEVTRSRVVSSSGWARLDSAAVEVTTERRYLPALNRDRPIGVWVSQRVCFVMASREEVEETGDCASLVEGG